jgi:hypothetical protein
MLNRAARVTTGEAGQAELKEMLESFGFTVVETGQERWLPTNVHERLRLDHSDRMVRAVRYMPDLLAWSPRFRLAYWDAKVNTHPGTANFTIETACYDEQTVRMAKGERVALAFKDMDGRWRAQWATRLRIVADHSARRREAQGSHTPYLLIAKDSTETITAFVGFGDRDQRV